MDLTSQEASAIKASFKLLLVRKVNLAGSFYDMLFELAPLIKPMFKNKSPNLEVHFNSLIESVVENIDNFAQIQTQLFDLGQMHKSFGVEESQFSVVKSALLLSIQYQLKQDCTELTLTAWAKYYDIIAQTMIKGLNAK
ncbi:globin domain-containing protein [Paraglaciecola aestuariivivens]